MSVRALRIDDQLIVSVRLAVADTRLETGRRDLIDFDIPGRRRDSLQTRGPLNRCYSYFSALIGSTRDARCAGMKPALSATKASATAESVSTTGSAPVI